MNNEQRDEMLIRIDERTTALHETLPVMQKEIDANTSTCSKLKGAAWAIAVVLVPVVVGVIGAHLK